MSARSNNKAPQFAFPNYYDLPPFFTIQPVEETQRKQLVMWSDLIRDYSKFNRIFYLDVRNAVDTDLFNNKKIQRKLGLDAVVKVLDSMVASGQAEWVSSGDQKNKAPSKERALILWKSFSEWADVVWTWVRNVGATNSVFTVMDLIDGDDSKGEEFHGIPFEVMMNVLALLEKKGRCQVFTGSNSDEHGVKFFAD